MRWGRSWLNSVGSWWRNKVGSGVGGGGWDGRRCFAKTVCPRVLYRKLQEKSFFVSVRLLSFGTTRVELLWLDLSVTRVMHRCDAHDAAAVIARAPSIGRLAAAQ